MRYKFNEYAPSGHRQYFIALNVHELDLLASFNDKILETLPRRGPLADTRNRVKNMAKALHAALAAAQELNDMGQRRGPQPGQTDEDGKDSKNTTA